MLSDQTTATGAEGRTLTCVRFYSGESLALAEQVRQVQAQIDVLAAQISPNRKESNP